MEIEIESIARALYHGAGTGQWALVALLLVVLAVYATRRWGAQHVGWLGTDRGGALLALLWGAAGGVLTAALAGELSLGTLYAGALVSLQAAGGWTLVRRLIDPQDS